MRKINWRETLPKIFTGVGILGTFGIVIAARHDSKKESNLPKEATKIDIAKCYIPTIAAVALTDAAFVASQVMNGKQIATLTASVAATAGIAKNYKSLLKEYKGKIIEVVGEEEYNKITQAIAKDHEAEISTAETMENYKKFGSSVDIVELGNDGQTLFYDALTKKWFRSSMLAVISAEYMLNRNMANGYGATLGDFYSLLGITCDSLYTELLSWDCEEFWEDENYWIDFTHTKAKADTGEEYYIIQYDFEPVAVNDEVYGKE